MINHLNSLYFQRKTDCESCIILQYYNLVLNKTGNFYNYNCIITFRSVK
jgi:hypothetical protein